MATSSSGQETCSLEEIESKLNSISPTMCLAKWLQVSMHLTTGKTHSCYHPPAHGIDREEILQNPEALHNTAKKREERLQMLQGKRPPGCSYCWKIEDSGNHYSDRHYRSLEDWAAGNIDKVMEEGSVDNIVPTYVEVNFNHACQFKCSYCSPLLSSSWMEEASKYGPYPTITPHNDLSALPSIPLNDENPFVRAFWKWWPKLYPQLRVFRMTGGEPLIDHNTFCVLDYIEKNPHPRLELAITTNLCPPEKMKNRFVDQLEGIMAKKKIFRFMLFPSIDSWGSQGEYIRHGLDTRYFEQNLRMMLERIPNLLVSFILTTNALSIFNLRGLLEKILEWQKEYSQWFRRIFFDTPCLYSPPWMHLGVLPRTMAKEYLTDSLSFMEANPVGQERGKYYGFSTFNINKMKRLLALVEGPVDKEQQKINRINFYKFFAEHDRRRQTNFLKTFPNLRDFYHQCQVLALERDKVLGSALEDTSH